MILLHNSNYKNTFIMLAPVGMAAEYCKRKPGARVIGYGRSSTRILIISIKYLRGNPIMEHSYGSRYRTLS
jgi:hypothetical protein